MTGSAANRVARLAFKPRDALAVESDPRVVRLLELMRERGWAGWNRMERLERP